MDTTMVSEPFWPSTYAIFTGIIALISTLIIAFVFRPNIKSAEELLRASIESTPNSPFEHQAVRDYYAKALSRTQISFWSGLFFSMFGFIVIVYSMITYNSQDLTGSLIKIASGSVIEAVSALFIVQARAAEKTMVDFFDKLRIDKMMRDARELLGEVVDQSARDQIRFQLVLKLANIDRLVISN